MKTSSPPLAPTLEAFDHHFAALHTCPKASKQLPLDLAAKLLSADICPFQPEEVMEALQAMRRGKALGWPSTLLTFSVLATQACMRWLQNCSPRSHNMGILASLTHC